MASAHLYAELFFYEDKPPGSRRGTAEEVTRIRDFLDRRYVHIQNIDRLIGHCTQDLLNDPDLKIGYKDAIHIAVALMTGTPAFLTYDGDGKDDLGKLLKLDQKLHLRMDPDQPTLRVVTPEAYWADEGLSGLKTFHGGLKP